MRVISYQLLRVYWNRVTDDCAFFVRCHRNRHELVVKRPVILLHSNTYPLPSPRCSVPFSAMGEFEVNEGTLAPQADSSAAEQVGERSAPIPTTDSATSTEVIKTIPLHAKWTIWYDNPRLAPAGSDWKENLQKCGSFDTVESFWRVFNNLKPASELTVNSNYSVFRYGVEPSWEDPANTEGGKFVYSLLKKDSKLGKCDEAWLFTVLAMIGETMDATGDQVNGAVVSIRKQQDRIALWLKSSDRDTCIEIGERWKKVLNYDKSTLRYQTHRDAAASGRSFRNEAQFEV